jgi:hypothetical protein
VVTQRFGTAFDLLENLVGDQADQTRQNSKNKHIPHGNKTLFSIPPYYDYALSIAAATVFTSLARFFICGSVRPAFQSRDGYPRIAALWRHAIVGTAPTIVLEYAYDMLFWACHRFDDMRKRDVMNLS